MRVRRTERVGAFLLWLLFTACRFDVTGQGVELDAEPPPLDSSSPPDSAPPIPDARIAPDAFVPSHCSDGVLNGTETDVDCGGPCSACAGCRQCDGAADCGSGSCDGGRCTPELKAITLEGGIVVNAFIREDGAILLAHYGPGARVVAYDTTLSQRAGLDGGGPEGPLWAPDPCRESGHLPLQSFDTAGKTVTLECGMDYGAPDVSVGSSLLFTDFTDGDKGTYADTGDPGWGIVATTGTVGRSTHGMCGQTVNSSKGGIAYCSGPGMNASYANHLVSYTTGNGGDSPTIGCGGSGCAGSSCPLEVWVWLSD